MISFTTFNGSHYANNEELNSITDEDFSKYADDVSYQREQRLPSHTIYDIGSNSEPVENNETNTIVSTNNATTHTHHSSESDKAELDIINDKIWAVWEDCTVRFELPWSDNEIRDIVNVWRRRGRGRKPVNPFMVYRALLSLSKTLDYKKKDFPSGAFQCYVSGFASKTWKKKTDSAKGAIKFLAIKINEYIEAKDLKPTLEL
ncbi:10735_t:CDS:1 [Paraglomus brasilianum]|uniref:10735_t:CDS:1 n=1 Tax=Paraglomus brasilianum TaxID=144538 RepID=A0A9N9GRZ7_9GLOM|nr:10735_t:CDS:1 [Paraglomus brasilianum]